VKKLLSVSILFLCAAFVSGQQSGEPVYIINYVVGLYDVCEFAENGTKNEEMKEFEPYINNGKIYFVSLGLPASTGKLRPGFEFMLSDTYKITGVYKGSQTDSVDSTAVVAVAGFAEPGRITITNVFTDIDGEEYNKWAASVKFAQ